LLCTCTPHHAYEEAQREHVPFHPGSPPKGGSTDEAFSWFFGRKESSVTCMVVLLWLRSVRDHRQRRWLDGLQCNLTEHGATIPPRHASLPSCSCSSFHLLLSARLLTG
jgi:hypothetical protein